MVRLSLLPACSRHPSVCDHPSQASLGIEDLVQSPSLSRLTLAAVQEAYCLVTPGDLGSDASYALSRHRRLLRPHPPVPQARCDFTAVPLIRNAFAVRERLGNPWDLPYFRCCPFLSCHRPCPDGPAASSHCTHAAIPGFPQRIKESPPVTPVSASYARREDYFGTASFTLCYGPRFCQALLTGYDKVKSRALHLAF